MSAITLQRSLLWFSLLVIIALQCILFWSSRQLIFPLALDWQTKTTIPSSVFCAGKNGHYYHSSGFPQSSYLPERLISVFGLESSGTTFVTSLLELSVGVKKRNIILGHDDLASCQENRSTEIQHLSLPFGSFCDQGSSTPPMIVRVLPPAVCSHPSYKKSRESDHASLCDGMAPLLPTRFFVNITSHIDWYRNRNVNAVAVLVIRDKSIGSMSRSLSHCPNATIRQQEERIGHGLLQEYMIRHQYDPSVIVSYETLMHMGAAYMNSILQNQLDLPPISEYTDIHNGNKRYLKPFHQVQLLAEEQKQKSAMKRVTSIRESNTIKDEDDDTRNEHVRPATGAQLEP